MLQKESAMSILLVLLATIGIFQLRALTLDEQMGITIGTNTNITRLTFQTGE